MCSNTTRSPAYFLVSGSSTDVVLKPVSTVWAGGTEGGNVILYPFLTPLIVAGGGSIIGAGAIASGEAIGQPTVSAVSGAQDIIGAGQIAGAESIGAPSISVTVSASAIASAESIGAPSIAATIAAAAIGSIETFGALDLQIVVSGSGIDSGEAVGQPVVSIPGAAWDITNAGGIVTEEAFGLATVAPYVAPDVGASFGGRLWRAPPEAAHIRGAGNIASGEIIGHPVISAGKRSRARRLREQRQLGIPA